MIIDILREVKSGWRRALPAFCAAGVLLAAAHNSYASDSTAQVNIADLHKPVRIICAKSSAQVTEIGRYLIGYLQARKFAVWDHLADRFDADYPGPQWILATGDTLKSVKMPGATPRFADGQKDETYVLEAGKPAGTAVVLLVGKTPAGLRAAVARLVAKGVNHGDCFSVAAGEEMNEPYITLRLVNVGQAARRQASANSPFRDANYENWPDAKIRAYPEMYWQLGFNGIQVDVCRGYGSITGEELRRAYNAVRQVSIGAKERHLFVSLSQWGDTLFDERQTHSWNNPKEQAVMKEFTRDLAEKYASIIDNVAVRIGDPGGCDRDGCDWYKTPQQITASYREIFKKINPRVTTTLSLWGNNQFWAYTPRKADTSNYDPWPGKMESYGRPIPDGAKFLDDTFMPKDCGIALQQVYNEQQATMVANAGRPVDIKGWYIADMEMNDNITLNMHVIDTMFKDMPLSAKRLVRAQTVEMCFHGWPQVINHYVAVQKLWNPKRPLDEIEMEFCTAAFGVKNARAMVDLYNACENGENSPIARPADFGTENYNRQLHIVLKEAQGVKLDANWIPNFSFPVPVQKYIDMMLSRLRLSLAVSEAKYAVDTARKNGASAEDISKIKKDAVDALPCLPVDPIYRQDASVVVPGYKTQTFAEMIEQL